MDIQNIPLTPPIEHLLELYWKVDKLLKDTEILPHTSDLYKHYHQRRTTLKEVVGLILEEIDTINQMYSYDVARKALDMQRQKEDN